MCFIRKGKVAFKAKDAPRETNSGRGSGAPGGEDDGFARRQRQETQYREKERNTERLTPRERQGVLMANKERNAR